MSFRRRYLLLALAGVALAAAGSVPWPADRLPLRAGLAGEVEAALGHEVAGGAATITLLPLPRVDFHDVVLQGDAGEVARAERVSVRLGLWALLTGRAQARHVTIHRPRIEWTGAQRPRGLWLLARERLVALADRDSGDSPAFPARVAIVDGTVTAAGGSRTLLRQLNGSVVWPSPRRTLDFSATAVWRGEPVDLRVDKLHPASLVAGLQSPVVLRFSAQPVSFSFSGLIGADALPTFDGLVGLRAGSLARAAAWLGTPLAFSRSTGQISIKTTARLTEEGLSMPGARIEIEGGTLEGALAVRHSESGRALLSATLDAAALDFNRLLAPARYLAPGPVPILPPDADTANDVDVRLSISRALLGPLEWHNVAAGIMASNGRVEFALNQAELEGGSVRGRLLLAAEAGETTARLTGTFDQVDAQRALQRLFGGTLFTGRASGDVALTATGRSAHPLPSGGLAAASELLSAHASGNVSARIGGGNLLGVDLPSVIDRARHSPLATALDWRGGHTPFDTAEATLAIIDGNGHLDGRLETGAVVGDISGAIGIAQRTLDLQATVRPPQPETDGEAGQAARARDGVGFPIEITGSWDYPIVTPDIRLLIERSNAVAPLRPGEARENPAHGLQ